jgi:hypothetical protein
MLKSKIGQSEGVAEPVRDGFLQKPTELMQDRGLTQRHYLRGAKVPPLRPMIAHLRIPALVLALAGLSPVHGSPDHPAEWLSQFHQLETEMEDRSWCARVAGQTEHAAALIAPGDRDPLDVVLRRSRTLLEHLASRPDAPDFANERVRLRALSEKAAAIGIGRSEERYAVYEEACRLRRAIAFRNPLLDFERLLFLTKHRPARGDRHMVDQYYGFNAKPGGSVYVLEEPFSDNPQARDLMAGRSIRGGRLAGRALTGGAFNTLELDSNGRDILFAWSECGPIPPDAEWSTQPWSRERARQNKRDHYFWHPQTTFHVLKAQVDGSDVAQLTDGAWNDFDPCFLPNGRIAFVSERRGGYNYGSLVLIDQSREDDQAMSQVRRLTPEALLPESEAAPGQAHRKGRHQPNGEVYGTPWPLSEEFHLCVYDPGRRNYGIYLLDCFGNKELLWRDPTIACLDPIPLRSRPRPPVIPTATCQAKADQHAGSSEKGTVAILDVYQSDFEWPEQTRIDAIRVVQLYPKSTFHLTEPMVGAAPQSLARGAVGTAPVESDGSAHFEVPTGVPLYFQALDADGLAIQSMRSATYVHPGERLSCIGCHEPKHRAPSGPSTVPLAWRRTPSILQAEHEDALPISFPRLVQPVLDKHCVSCHAGEEAVAAKAPDLSGRLSDPHGWSAGFTSLKPFAWSYSGGNGIISKEGSRSPAGQIGARASRLLPYLEPTHHKVKLTPSERRRITLWLDCNSNFYGAYHELRAQGEGQRVEPEVR